MSFVCCFILMTFFEMVTVEVTCVLRYMENMFMIMSSVKKEDVKQIAFPSFGLFGLLQLLTQKGKMSELEGTVL